MKLRKCNCGGEPKAYEFVVQCNECGTSTRCYARHEEAVRAWNEKEELIRRYPLKGECQIDRNDIYAE